MVIMFDFSAPERGIAIVAAETLVKIRASQINGCAGSIELHTRDARKAGESKNPAGSGSKIGRSLVEESGG